MQILFRITQEPKNLKEMQEILTLYHELLEDLPKIEEKFPAITEQLAVLDKYSVPIKEGYRKLEQNIPTLWGQYLETLEQSNKMINYAKVILKESATK